MILKTPQLYLSADSVDGAKVIQLNYPVDFFNLIPGTASFLAHILTLKKEYVFMLLHNLHWNNGHVNISQYNLEPMEENFPFLLIATGNNKGKLLVLSRTHLYLVSLTMAASLLQVSNELSFLFESVLWSQSTSPKVNHLALQSVLILSTNGFHMDSSSCDEKNQSLI